MAESVTTLRRKVKRQVRLPISSDSLSSSGAEGCSSDYVGRSQSRMKRPVHISPSYLSTRDEFGIKHRIASTMWTKPFDPFQLFKVAHKPCCKLQVHVVEGKDITRGWFRDLLYGPDPYLLLRCPGTPNGCKRTRSVGRKRNPVWNETFTFLQDPDKLTPLELVLMDANYMLDRVVGRVIIDLSELVVNVEQEREVIFENDSKVTIKLLKLEDAEVDLRLSLALSNEEKSFLALRRVRVFDSLSSFLGKKRAPRTLREVPCIAILGSGGGFRAMSGFSGAMKALHECGLLDCSMFIATLSGSCWYLSYLYSQPTFPQEGPSAFQEDLRQKVGDGWFHVLGPSALFRYISAVVRKSRGGQPVSFTDFFGHLVGDIILGDAKNKKLSEQKEKLKGGQSPLPLYTCLNVKKNVSARVYQDWVEFTPYECGLAKYGTFMHTELFGSKFYLGKLLRRFEEPSLHFLLGLWGSAFCILFKRLVQENNRCDQPSYDEATARELLDNYVASGEDLPELNNDTGSSDEEVDSRSSDAEDSASEIEGTFTNNSSLRKDASGIPTSKNIEQHQSRWRERSQTRQLNKEQKQKSFWRRILEGLFNSSFLDNRTGRAGLVYNPLRGLDLRSTFPLSPFSSCPSTTSSDMTDFLGTYESVEPDAKRLFLVDAGLSFNLPFPILLRPQRAVDVYLTFDFSGRPSDTASPFQDLIMAERWARLNGVPFPPVRQLCARYLREPQRECYVFYSCDDPYCPVVIFFPLINSRFQKYKFPGIRRSSQEEFEFGKFSIFNDPNACYSLYNFRYTNQQFDRLAGLMEFNTLDSLDVIRCELAKAVARKRQLLPRLPVALDDIHRMSTALPEDSVADLRRYISMMSGMVHPHSDEDTESEDEEEIDEMSLEDSS